MERRPIPAQRRTQEYGSDIDSVDRWVEAHMAVSTDYWTPSMDLYEHYVKHADARPVSAAAWGRRLSKIGVRAFRNTKSRGWALVEKEGS